MSRRIKAVANLDLQALFAAPQASRNPISHRADHDREAIAFSRLCLAVRGWVEPMGLVRKLAGDRTEAVVATLASEVETTAATRAGQWFLRSDARRQALAASEPDELSRALQGQAASDPEDPFLRAFAIGLDSRPIDLAGLTPAVLRALVNAREWLGVRWRQSAGAAEINAALAGKILDADLERMTAMPLVGEAHKHALEALEQFASPSEKDGLHAIYVHAPGGGGKTTLLAFFQRALLAKTGTAAIARIDFDEPGIDPSMMITLNLALFEQLASSLPQIQGRIAYFLPQLRETASALRMSDYAEDSPLAGWDWRRRGRSSLRGQRQITGAEADQASILFGLLAPETLNGPLVLVLDTAELVTDGDAQAAAGIAAWLDFLATEVQARDIRLIIAGRDPPPDSWANRQVGVGGLFSRLAGLRAEFDPPIALSDLRPQESAELLANCGISDARLRQAAAEAVPGNPLLLRITADALKAGDADVLRDVRSAHALTQVDRHSAQIYLMRRIIAHVPDPAVRPYVIAALASPILTAGMLEAVIIPLVDGDSEKRVGRRKARRVFAGIERTAWLGRLSLDGKRFTFNRDLRPFAVTLVDAVDEDRALHARMHEALFAYHARRRDPLDRALGYFHARSLGQRAILPRGDKALRILRDLADQFPQGMGGEIASQIDDVLAYRESTVREAYRARVPESAKGRNPLPGEVLPAPPDAFIMEDPDWRFYLEGRNGKPGQGDQLVADDRAAEALAMYREKPTRERGRPPTFVIQALADLGEWDGKDVDVRAIVRELGAKFSSRKVNAELDRIYWITRFALQRDAGKLSEPHIRLIEKCCEFLKGPSLAMFPPLVAIVEAFSGGRILSLRVTTGAGGNEGEGRIHLVRRQKIATKIAIGQFAVTQRDWLEQVRRTGALSKADSLNGVQRMIDELHGQPIAFVNQQFARFRQDVGVAWDGEDMKAGNLLLRGMTAEFHRPLRETLANVISEKGIDVLGPAIDRTLSAMTIRPAEMEPKIFYERLRANPRGWLSGFVNYVDRSRLLPSFCDAIARDLADVGRAGPNAARVARSFLAWDEALGGGSDWRTMK